MLRVRGPLSRLRTLEPAQTGVVIDLRGAGEGEHEFAVETRNVIVPDRTSRCWRSRRRSCRSASSG